MKDHLIKKKSIVENNRKMIQYVLPMVQISRRCLKIKSLPIAGSTEEIGFFIVSYFVSSIGVYYSHLLTFLRLLYSTYF